MSGIRPVPSPFARLLDKRVTGYRTIDETSDEAREVTLMFEGGLELTIEGECMGEEGQALVRVSWKPGAP